MKATCMLMLAALALTLFALLPVAQAEAIDVTLVSLTSPIHAGEDATIVIKTVPKARCQIKVSERKVRGLAPKSADSNGRVSWTWRIDSNAEDGDWPIAVACSLERQKARVKSSFQAILNAELVVK